ncbi:MAG: DNA cytosine methyltransferase [Patescibacteria group bacterium]|nr:DNA cytosine methyltransferase [Patescibacteria group bacterium]MDE2437975.1 DNA cytosine methyltransferase [Patescibacteria group bacterium]
MTKKKSPLKKYTVTSLFSGCGGLDLGFKGGFSVLGKKYGQRSFDILWANDFDENACFTFSKNFGDPIVCGDIVQILRGNYPESSNPKIPEKADVILGGFPCQDFSLAGKRKGFAGGRGLLYQSMVEVVKRLRPALFVAENVRGLLSMNNGAAIATIIKDFSDLGYNVVYKLHHAADFGVPQNRERVIIVGTDKKRNLPAFEYPKSTHDNEERVTLLDAIGDLENKKEGELPNHYWSKAKMFPGTQGNTITSPDKIGPTMRAEHHGNIEWHWNKKRRLSAREAARIQTFPDDFIFYPSTSSAYKQIGNAVPPVLGWHIATAVEKFLNKYL